MSMIPKIWNLSAAASELGVDRRKLGALVAKIPPEGKDDSGRDGWLLSSLVKAIRADDGGLDLSAERARLAKEQADGHELKNAMLRRELLKRTDVDQAVQAAFSRVRARFLAVPPKLAPIVVTADSPVVAQTMIMNAVHEVLRELSETSITDMGVDDAELVADAGPAEESDGQ